jgi:hypothetical protein
MKKLLLVLSVVLALSLASFAAQKSTTYDYTFSGYCDGVELVVSNNYNLLGPGYPQVFIGGYHELVNACGFRFDGTDVGLVHPLQKQVPPHYGTPGAVLDVADNALDATGGPFGAFTGGQAEFVLDTVGMNWAIYASFFGDSTNYLLNFGTLTPGLPAHVKNPQNPKTSFGSFKK